jgi:membrane-bound lytic murein transglycosylase MltF
MMTFYNYIENVRYEMFSLVNGWTRKGAETKARISQSLDQARYEYNQLKAENDRLRKLCAERGIEV